MALPVVSNISSINAQRNLQRSTMHYSKSMERLSSGLRINRSGDDAAGLAISEGLRSQIRGLNQAVRNSNDGLSLIGTAESAMNSYTEILQRIRELAVQSANDTNSASNRAALNMEVSQHLEELGRISGTVEFNGIKLFDGTFTAKQLQVGAKANQTISINTGDLRTNQMGMVARTTGTITTPGTALSAGELFLNGIDIGSTASDGVSTANPAASAIAMVKAINAKTAEHGVTAVAVASSYSSVAAVAGGVIDPAATPSQQLTINNIPIFDASVTVLSNDSNGNLASAINAKSNLTGVTAKISTGGNLILEAADGRNIDVATTGSIGDNLGLRATDGDFAVTRGGGVQITSASDIAVTGSAPTKAGLAVTNYPKSATTALNYLSVSTATGATLAIDMVDNALDQINSIRSRLGAITNRLEHTIQNLQAISENLEASDSRIRDADFAYETATMTRNQILQQAGIAILSQANSSTQNVLQLLRQ